MFCVLHIILVLFFGSLTFLFRGCYTPCYSKRFLVSVCHSFFKQHVQLYISTQVYWRVFSKRSEFKNCLSHKHCINLLNSLLATRSFGSRFTNYDHQQLTVTNEKKFQFFSYQQHSQSINKDGINYIEEKNRTEF